jgi:lathosterol oxidase
MKMLWGFKYTNGQFVNGKIRDPGNVKTYNSSMWLLENEKLEIRGYWGPFFRTQVWEKASKLSATTLSKIP